MRNLDTAREDLRASSLDSVRSTAETDAEIVQTAALIAIAEELRTLNGRAEARTEPKPATVLTVEQQQRQEAIGTARVALTSSGFASRKIDSETAGLLVSIAHYIATGDRDYRLTDGERIEHGVAPKIGEEDR